MRSHRYHRHSCIRYENPYFRKTTILIKRKKKKTKNKQTNKQTKKKKKHLDIKFSAHDAFQSHLIENFGSNKTKGPNQNSQNRLLPVIKSLSIILSSQSKDISSALIE